MNEEQCNICHQSNGFLQPIQSYPCNTVTGEYLCDQCFEKNTFAYLLQYNTDTKGYKYFGYSVKMTVWTIVYGVLLNIFFFNHILFFLSTFHQTWNHVWIVVVHFLFLCSLIGGILYDGYFSIMSDSPNVVSEITRSMVLRPETYKWLLGFYIGLLFTSNVFQIICMLGYIYIICIRFFSTDRLLFLFRGIVFLTQRDKNILLYVRIALGIEKMDKME